MAITHIEVIDAKSETEISSGQLLKIIGETPAFFWVESFGGKIQYKVSKQTKRIAATRRHGRFGSAKNQPVCSF